MSDRSDARDDFFQRGREHSENVFAKQVSSLQRELAQERNERREERFLWVLVIIVIANMAAFPLMATWGGPIVIGLFQLIGIVVLADRLGINAVAPLLDRISGMVRVGARRTDE